MAVGVPQGGRVNASITTLHEIYFYLWDFLCLRTPYDTVNFVFWIRLFSMMTIYSLITYAHFSNILPSIMASLPVKIGTLLFALNLSNYLLPDVIGLAWWLCLAQHSMARG